MAELPHYKRYESVMNRKNAPIVCGTFTKKSGVVYTNNHFHDYYELEFITGGSGIQQINGVNYAMKKGTVSLLTPVDMHQYIFKTGESADIENISFDIDYLPSQLQSDAGSHITTFFACLEGEDYDFVLGLIKKLQAELKRRPDYDRILVKKILEVICLACLEHNLMEPHEAKTQNPKINRVIAYINQNFRDELHIAKLSELFDMSPNYLGRLFKKELDMSIPQYVCMLRLSLAKKMLENTGCSIKEAAYDVGFHSYNNFYYEFKRKYGYSPSSLSRKDKT